MHRSRDRGRVLVKQFSNSSPLSFCCWGTIRWTGHQGFSGWFQFPNHSLISELYFSHCGVSQFAWAPAMLAFLMQSGSLASYLLIGGWKFRRTPTGSSNPGSCDCPPCAGVEVSLQSLQMLGNLRYDWPVLPNQSACQAFPFHRLPFVDGGQ